MKMLTVVAVLLLAHTALFAETSVFTDTHNEPYSYGAKNVSGSIVSVTGQTGSASFRTIAERTNSSVEWRAETRDVGHDTITFRVMAFQPSDFGNITLTLFTNRKGKASTSVALAPHMPANPASLAWQEISIPFSAFGIEDGNPTYGLRIEFSDPTRQIWWDDIGFTYTGVPEEEVLTLFIGDVLTEGTTYTHPIVVWGKTGTTFRLESTTSLSEPLWVSTTPIEITAGNFIRIGQASPTSFPHRFFRAVLVEAELN